MFNLVQWGVSLLMGISALLWVKSIIDKQTDAKGGIMDYLKIGGCALIAFILAYMIMGWLGQVSGIANSGTTLSIGEDMFNSILQQVADEAKKPPTFSRK